MTSQEKANELVNKFKPYVYPFIGSSFMTGDEYPEQILNQAKICALIVVDELLEDYEEFPYKIQEGKEYWLKVKKEIENL